MPLNVRTLVWLVLGRNLEWSPRRKRRGPPRDARYGAWIRTLACVACGRRSQVEAAHTGSDRGMSQKASDYSCVPLCFNCHTGGNDAFHRLGKEAFERKHGIDCATVVRALNAAYRRQRESQEGDLGSCQH